MNIESNKGSAKERMMAYLYDELSVQEKQAFEQEMEEHPDLKQELKELQQTRGLLGIAYHQKVSTPPIQQLLHQEKKGTNSNPFKWVGSIAASLLIILFAAKFSGLNISSNEYGTNISFNSNSNDNGDYIHKDQVKSMIDNSLVAYDQKLSKQLDERSNEQKELIHDELENSHTLFAKSLEKFKTDNRQMMVNYWNRSNQQQQAYMTSLMGDYTNFIEQKRNDDMQYLLAKINLLETDTDLLELENLQIRNSVAMNSEESTY